MIVQLFYYLFFLKLSCAEENVGILSSSFDISQSNIFHIELPSQDKDLLLDNNLSDQTNCTYNIDEDYINNNDNANNIEDDIDDKDDIQDDDQDDNNDDNYDDKHYTESDVIVSAFNSNINSPSNEEITHYFLLKELRSKGFTCPNGQTFPPNNKPFAFDCRPWRAATNYAKYMGDNNYFGHVDLQGKDPCDRTVATGLIACSENIAAGQNSAKAALDAFKGSTHHCPNMMDPALNRIGVGYYYAPSSSYKYYWVQNMGTDDFRGDISCNPPNPRDTENLPVGESCRDYNEKCKSFQGYAGTSYCDDRWASTQCKKTCGLCKSNTSPQPTPSTSAPLQPSSPFSNPASNCVDLQPDNCRSYSGYAGSIYCGQSYGNGWAFINCKKTCGLC